MIQAEKLLKHFSFSLSLLSSSISSQELPIRLHSPPHTDSTHSFLLQLLLHLSDSSHNVCSFHSKSANSYTYKRCECKGGLWELALVSSSAFTAESFRSTGESSTCTVSFTTCLFTADTETEAKWSHHHLNHHCCCCDCREQWMLWLGLQSMFSPHSPYHTGPDNVPHFNLI